MRITCEYCNHLFYRISSHVGKHSNSFCSKSCYDSWQSGNGVKGKDHPRWKGGRYLEKNGYVRLWLPDGHKFEHRVVMEKVLGRPLLSSETIHHKNGNRSDNRIENLELWKSRHPIGSRTNDLSMANGSEDYLYMAS